MEGRKDIYQLWVQYTTKNDEEYFRSFIKGFVDIWEQQLNLSWAEFPDSSSLNHDSGPHLSRLPEELLPAITKFMYVAKDDLDKNVQVSDTLIKAELLVKCLIVICRNFDNVPFIASCDYISLTVDIASIVVQKLVSGNELDNTGVSFFLHFCHLLESLYDPYFTWRNFLRQMQVDFGTFALQPALLHVEVIPFVYDCFETPLAEIFPELGIELLHVLGSAISGARSNINLIPLDVNERRSSIENHTQHLNDGHNALRAICPATVNIITSLVANTKITGNVRQAAVQCFVMTVHVLIRSSPDQRQIEISTVIQLYQDSLMSLIQAEWKEKSCDSLCELVRPLHVLLSDRTIFQQLQMVMVNNNILETMIYILEEYLILPLPAQSLAVVCVETIAALLNGPTFGKERMAKIDGYERLKKVLEGLGQLSKNLLQAVLSLSVESEMKLKDPQGLLMLIKWITNVSYEDQQWLASSIYQLCTVNLPSKMLSCQNGLIFHICQALSEHTRLSNNTANELIKLLEALATHSITSYELKQIFLLLREDGPEKFPFRMQLLHAVSSVARKGDQFHCNNYFDIQHDCEGINVPDIRKWLGASYGFSFHCWVRLDKMEEQISETSVNCRRQLFNLMTNLCTGLEAFFRSDGCLIVGVNTKKEFLTACVSDVPLLDGLWHCLDICYLPARRPFGQNQLSVYIDGTQRMTASIRSFSMTDPFSFCNIGSAMQRVLPIPSDRNTGSGDRGNILDKTMLPSIITQMPNYFSLPLRSSTPLDPSVKSLPAGMQDAVLGTPTCLHGQIGLACLFQEALTQQQVRSLYEGGPNCLSLLAVDDVSVYADLNSKLVFCYSPSACWNNLCVDLAPSNKYNGHIVAAQCQTYTLKNIVNGIGGIPVLFPLLENASKTEDGPDLSFISPSVEKEFRLLEDHESSVDSDEWEILPSSSYSDWKLEQNPVSGFLSLLKNVISGSPGNQEVLLKNNILPIIGSLLSKTKSPMIDVNVLMAVQLIIEMARDIPNAQLLRQLHQHILFNFKIWSHTQFHIRIGHVQYISSVLKDDRKYYRKKYGIQFLLDVIRQYYSSCKVLSAEDSKTIRISLLGLVKFYIQKELNVKELSSILGFVASVEEEVLLVELLDLLITHMESKSCKDQLFILFLEPHTGELLYCLLIKKAFGLELKKKVLMLLSLLLNTDRVYERSKARLRLQDSSLISTSPFGMYPGLLTFLCDQHLPTTVASLLLDQILLTDCSGSYAGALAMLNVLSAGDLELKLLAAKKILTVICMRVNSVQMFAKQTGWQDCITKLLIKNPIKTLDQVDSLPDLMTFDEESLDLEGSTHSSISKISSQVTDAALVLENEIKEVAESMTNAVADNIHYAADNISSVVASAYSVFRQKTVEMQESLEELGESAVSRLKKRRSLLSLYETQPEKELSSPQLEGNVQLLASLRLEHEPHSLDNRSTSSSSTEDLSSPNPSEKETHNCSKDSISIASVNSVSNASNQPVEEICTKVPEAIKQWSDLDPEKLADQEEELCYLVENILFYIMWKGVEGTSKESWKERGQVMACINLLGLNNELYCSHLQLKLHLLEMGVRASLCELHEPGTNVAHAENAAQLLRWVYDLVVLDPSPDLSKKTSTKLLDGVLGLVDTLIVFQDGPIDEWSEMAKLVFDILLSCAAYDNLELCAIATAKLHTLIQTRMMRDLNEGGYLLYFLNKIVQKTIEDNNQEHYSFLIPVVKALLEKLGSTFSLGSHLPGFPQAKTGPAFFEDFQIFCQSEVWKTFVDKKIKPLHESYEETLNSQLSEVMNIFWAECYEASKCAAHKRHKEVADSKARFVSQVIVPYRLRKNEDIARYNNQLNQMKNRDLEDERKWRLMKEFLLGPRGAWRLRTQPDRHWKLSHHENSSRMRLKLCPNLNFDPHTDASNLRDNTGWLSRMRPDDNPLSINISSEARRMEAEEDNLPEEDIRLFSEKENENSENTGKEKLILSQDCDLVTLMNVVKGRLDITTTQVTFSDLSPVKEDVERQDFKWILSRLREIHLRRYNLRRSALEFFLTDQTNYFLNFPNKSRNKVFSSILSLRPQNLLHYTSRPPVESLRSSGITHKWVNREISNFDYLMQLNTMAGRTYNDLSQYPVFPWILADYTSEELDLSNPSTFRDLSKPIGVVNPKNIPDVKSKYDNFEDPTGTIAKFHYGTHYSNSAGVLHYLVRVEPFTSLHIELQSGRFDVADRQFHSIPQTWKLLMDNPNDVKELTPEFFYFPEFLKNMNNFDLGLLQGTKERVNDVILPNWAESAEDFIYKHKKALESDYVSAHLHEWIDLIFGYKQKGPKAVEALNVFFYCSYEGAVDLDAITDSIEREAVEGMINNFGQTPSQLLKEPHPKRLTLEEAVQKMLKAELKKVNFTLFLNNIQPFPIEVSNDIDPVIFVSIPRSPPRTFLQATLPDTLVTISQSGIIGVHSWQPFERHGTKGFTFDVDPTLQSAKHRRKISGPFHPSLALHSNLFVISHDAKFLFSGGSWDNSLRVYSVSKGKTVSSVKKHLDIVTCIALDQCGSFIISGSRDTTCIIWDISQIGVGGSSSNLTPIPMQTLYGHDMAVSCVGIITELDMAVSGSLDGTVNVHTIQEGQYIRTLYPIGIDGPNVEVHFITLSLQGHIAFSASNKVCHSVHVFSVNGTNLGSKYVSGRVTGLTIAGEYLIVGDDAGDLTMSRLLKLSPVYDIPLHVPIQAVAVTTGNTHVLVPLQDGKIIVLGVLNS